MTLLCKTFVIAIFTDTFLEPLDITVTYPGKLAKWPRKRSSVQSYFTLPKWGESILLGSPTSGLSLFLAFLMFIGFWLLFLLSCPTTVRRSYIIPLSFLNFFTEPLISHTTEWPTLKCVYQRLGRRSSTKNWLGHFANSFPYFYRGDKVRKLALMFDASRFWVIFVSKRSISKIWKNFAGADDRGLYLSKFGVVWSTHLWELLTGCGLA